MNIGPARDSIQLVSNTRIWLSGRDGQDLKRLLIDGMQIAVHHLTGFWHISGDAGNGAQAT